MKQPANVEVGGYDDHSKRAAVSWEMDGARFHVWVKLPALEIEKNTFGTRFERTIYKNPPVGTKRVDPAHFNTRYLDADAKGNAAILEQVFEIVNREGLVAKAIRAAEEQERKRHEESRAAALERRKEAAGPKLFGAIRAFDETVVEQSPGFFVVKGARNADYNRAIAKLRALLAEIEEAQ